MENYLIDKKVLDEFVDGLLTARPSRKDERERMIKRLDDEVGLALFGSLTSEQLEEVNMVLDNDGSWQTIKEFFEKHNIDFRALVKTAMEKFAKNFLEDKVNE